MTADQTSRHTCGSPYSHPATTDGAVLNRYESWLMLTMASGAAGEGSAAAIAINADLVDEDVRNAVRDLDQGLQS
jgi:hypothetical protein